MSGSQLLRLRVNERLEAAVEEIFGLVEKTITEYEEEAVRSKREIGQLKQQLEQLVVLKPEVILNRADTQSFFEEILPDQQQPDRPPDVEENGPWDSGGVKEEPVDRLIGPDAEAEPATEAEARCLKPERGGGGGGAGSGSGSGSGSAPPRKQVDQCVVTDFREDLLQVRLPEPAAQTDFQLFPTSGTITVTLNEEEDDDYAASSSSSAAQVAGQVCHFYGERFGRDSDLIAHIDQVHTDQIHTDQIHTDRIHTDRIHTDRIHTDQVHTDQIHTDQVHTDQVHTDQVHTSARAFKCPECNKRFACRAHLVAHLRIHTGEKPYRCSFCARSFAQSSNLNVHLRMHTGEKPYFCRACGKMVARSNHLKTCGKTRLERRRAFRCSPCGKTFRAAAKLRAHERTHEAGTS